MKTVEDEAKNQAIEKFCAMRCAKKLWINCNHKGSNCKLSESYVNEINDVFKEGVEFAQRWINIEDELPEPGEVILVKFKNDNISTAIFISGKFSVDFQDMEGAKITHWRSIEIK